MTRPSSAGPPASWWRDAGYLTVDVLVIGSGAGGSAMAYALRDTGARVLVVERGERIPRLPPGTPLSELRRSRAALAAEQWRTGDSRVFTPRNHYCVGGNTKFYAAHLPRFREHDFAETVHRDGISPAWPFTYADLEPYYSQAEELFGVHGSGDVDPTEPPRSAGYPHQPVPHEPYVARLAHRLEGRGLHPYPLPLAISLHPGGRCVRCPSCDGYPCLVGAKSDAEVAALQPALSRPTVALLTGTEVRRLDTGPDGSHIRTATAVHRGQEIVIRAGTVVVSAGAVNSAALLLRSGGGAHTPGLSNGTGLVGARYMSHHLSYVLGIDPGDRNSSVFQKTLGLNDFYAAGPATDECLGNVQLVGKLTAESFGAPGWEDSHGGGPLEGDDLAAHSVEWLCMSEDLPDPDNRVRLDPSGHIVLDTHPRNGGVHRELSRRVRTLLLDVGFPRVAVKPIGIEATSHQCGTVVAGADPSSSVLDPFCRSHEIANLFVVDAAFFPSSAALNPALTIVAQALRVGERGGVLP